MAEQDDLRDEIIRLRDRNHETLNALAGLRFQVEDLREWRAEMRVLLAELSRRCDDLAEQIERVLKADEIAEAVVKTMREQHKSVMTSDALGLTRWQLRIAIVAVAAAIASPFLAHLVPS